MTNEQLINILKQYPKDAEVVLLNLGPIEKMTIEDDDVVYEEDENTVGIWNIDSSRKYNANLYANL